MFVKSSPLHRLPTQHFDERYKHKHIESFLIQPEHTIWVWRHRTLKTQYLHLGVFLWKQYIRLASYKDFWKLQSFCFCTSLLTLSLSFQAPTYWNCHLHKRLLPDEVFQWWYFFLFLGASFANIPPTFLISREVQTRYSKTLK